MYRTGSLRTLISNVMQRHNPAAANTALTLMPRRGMFSDEYLGLDNFKRKRNSRLLTMEGDRGRREFLDNVRGTFEQSGMKNVFSEDLVLVLDLAETDDDVALASKMLRACMTEMESGGRDMPNLPRYISLFFSLCMVDNNVAAATDLWMSEELRKTGFERSLRTLRIKYMTMMFNNGLYQDVVDNFKATPEGMHKLDDITLVLAALHRLGTDEAFKEASEIMASVYKPRSNIPVPRESAGFRGTFIYAHFAVQKGEFGTAYDILVDKRRSTRSSLFSSNLKLLVLTKVGRLTEAIQLIKLEMLPSHGGRRKVVCFEVIQGLAAAIKEANSPTSDLAKEFTILCKTMDDNAELSEQTMEEMLFQPIEKYSRERPPPKRDGRFDRSRRESWESAKHEL